MLPLRSPGSWTASWLASTGKPASSTWITSSSSRHLGRAPRPPPTSLRVASPRTTQTWRRKMHFCSKGSQLPRPPGQLRRPLARPYSTSGHQGDRPPQDCNGSSLIPGPRRVLAALCQEFCRHCRAYPCSHQERCGLPLGSRVSRRLRPPQNSPHHQPHHCLPGLQPAIPVIHRRLHCRPQSNPRTSTGRQGAHYLLCLALPQPSGESLPHPETGVPRHRLGHCQIPPLPDVNVVRSLYRPLALQWLKTMRTESALLHRWSAALEEYDFII